MSRRLRRNRPAGRAFRNGCRPAHLARSSPPAVEPAASPETPAHIRMTPVEPPVLAGRPSRRRSTIRVSGRTVSRRRASGPVRPPPRALRNRAGRRGSGVALLAEGGDAVARSKPSPSRSPAWLDSAVHRKAPTGMNRRNRPSGIRAAPAGAEPPLGGFSRPSALRTLRLRPALPPRRLRRGGGRGRGGRGRPPRSRRSPRARPAIARRSRRPPPPGAAPSPAAPPSTRTARR